MRIAEFGDNNEFKESSLSIVRSLGCDLSINVCLQSELEVALQALTVTATDIKPIYFITYKKNNDGTINSAEELNIIRFSGLKIEDGTIINLSKFKTKVMGYYLEKISVALEGGDIEDNDVIAVEVIKNIRPVIAIIEDWLGNSITGDLDSLLRQEAKSSRENPAIISLGGNKSVLEYKCLIRWLSMHSGVKLSSYSLVEIFDFSKMSVSQNAFVREALLELVLALKRVHSNLRIVRGNVKSLSISGAMGQSLHNLLKMEEEYSNFLLDKSEKITAADIDDAVNKYQRERNKDEYQAFDQMPSIAHLMVKRGCKALFYHAVESCLQHVSDQQKHEFYRTLAEYTCLYVSSDTPYFQDIILKMIGPENKPVIQEILSIALTMCDQALFDKCRQYCSEQLNAKFITDLVRGVLSSFTRRSRILENIIVFIIKNCTKRSESSEQKSVGDIYLTKLMHLAMEFDNAQMVEILLDHGAKPLAKLYHPSEAINSKPSEYNKGVKALVESAFPNEEVSSLVLGFCLFPFEKSSLTKDEDCGSSCSFDRP